ncbi:MAG: hypothetical protein HC849_30620 [Oscillatoriales cyanobacterium RU_3_3]|nr:hypothetical protein [Oscillatoriales cyanobacterium RU_3_3]
MVGAVPPCGLYTLIVDSCNASVLGGDLKYDARDRNIIGHCELLDRELGTIVARWPIYLSVQSSSSGTG